ncbi:hypothetical protein UFOVP1470_11 [uncultured Caudovirales phage]|uniref:Uncharacterized protein n=1 Tax=uncultured Caudovirales phage TaxID=2100421 RepID=A0A6J5Q322_9CAUD|nr:hypothetical protein UFOVP939_15 [uncultured Caudovirales phage]CAB4178553.1 hypothetical protein UFOVP1018_9 [uncultured Caudovirales phage]CAB4183837.1 hypothetical protein UFOVP1105_10 [uncultured Caudovirales phage]CAB4202972.1 hypothetical protein UFOVP1372_54 [uncultured Caudovirales phage]CAB4214973.1 hypothetical protein UFOVP1470_11 [uncultured Caudovirales phage]
MTTLEEMMRNRANQGEIRNTPRNMLGGVADVLDPVSKFLSRFKLPESIPLLGGADAADLTGVKGSQGLLDDMSYGKSPIRGASLQTTTVDPRLLDLAGLTSVAAPVGKALGKAAVLEGAKQIQTGTGLLGSRVINPRMGVVPEGPSIPQRPKTQYELAHEVAQRNAAKPVSEGGLGLPADNMALDRAKAMTGMDFPSRQRIKNSIVDMVEGPNPNVSISGFKEGNGQKWYARQGAYMPGENPIINENANTWQGLREKIKNLGVEDAPEDIGTPGYQSVSRVFKHKPTVDELARRNAIDEARWAESKDVYLRYGDAPKGGRSKNYRDNTLESGVSVFKGRVNPEGSVSINATTNDQLGSFATLQGRPVYIADGMPSGIGADGEPTLMAVKLKNIKDVVPDMFGADGLYSTTAANLKGLIRSRFAAFDPMRRHEADILAGVGVGGLLDPQLIEEELRKRERK